MNKKDRESFIEEVKNYLGLLEEPRSEYEGLPACPFIKKERISNKLLVDVFIPEEQSFFDKMEEFVNSNFTDAVFAQQISDVLPTEDSKIYQGFLNGLLKEKYSDYRAVVINPNDKFSVRGFNPRRLAPCFLIVVTDKIKLGKAHNQMMNSKYFTNFGDDYLKYLNVKREQLNLK